MYITYSLKINFQQFSYCTAQNIPNIYTLGHGVIMSQLCTFIT